MLHRAISIAGCGREGEREITKHVLQFGLENSRGPVHV